MAWRNEDMIVLVDTLDMNLSLLSVHGHTLIAKNTERSRVLPALLTYNCVGGGQSGLHFHSLHNKYVFMTILTI